MWRHGASPRNREHVQSLSGISHPKKRSKSSTLSRSSLYLPLSSDDEELDEVTYDHDFSNNLQSLYSHEKKGQRSLVWKTKSLKEVGVVSSSRYGVGMNGFEDENLVAVQSQPRKVQYSDFGDESISDEVVGRGKAKPKFSIHSQSHDEELPWFHDVNGRNEDFSKEVSEGPGRQNYLEHRTSGNSMTELLENLQKENDELPAELLSHEQRGALLSISELLDNLQDKDLLQDAKTKNKRAHFARKRMLPNLGTRTLDDEDPLEVIVGGMSSEDEEVDQNHLSLATQKSKEQTMTDLFQEAFNSSTVEGPLFPTSRLAGAGYHERLQQIMQIEKDKHLDFLKQLQSGQSPLSSSRCMNVQILSRSLEGKLIVCHCLLDENNKSSSCGKGSHECTDDRGTRKRTVIFSSKICDNVELDIGNLVHIHPPWKEVQVSKDEKIILCSYFSLVVA
ncbi:hypothetical protein COCNU_05G009540 [Cocos nucifera]|uniref:Uncharacterized protein n=1 Tax=Cocos nucifera TaxID=13894 RepID=A0A8K0IAJ7_COCNU|nr:hypothetical protein COCNU_05G009540 [Cocos nucifera]